MKCKNTSSFPLDGTARGLYSREGQLSEFEQVEEPQDFITYGTGVPESWVERSEEEEINGSSFRKKEAGTLFSITRGCSESYRALKQNGAGWLIFDKGRGSLLGGGGYSDLLGSSCGLDGWHF